MHLEGRVSNMKTMLIYDNAGTIWVSITGDYAKPDGLPYLETEIPEGYFAASVNVETQEPILQAYPKSDMEKRMEELEAQVAAMTGTEE